MRFYVWFARIWLDFCVQVLNESFIILCFFYMTYANFAAIWIFYFVFPISLIDIHFTFTSIKFVRVFYLEICFLMFFRLITQSKLDKREFKGPGIFSRLKKFLTYRGIVGLRLQDLFQTNKEPACGPVKKPKMRS